MSWTDLASIEHIKKLRDIYNVKTFVETGTHKGTNAKLHGKNFNLVVTCDIINNVSGDFGPNVSFHISDSSEFLRDLVVKEPPIYYLDAHFYDPKRDNKFVVLDELKALEGNTNCVIIIHDFDNGLGHITYDGQPLNLELLKEHLLNVNPNFKFYTNELSSCNIKKLEDAEDWDEFDNLKYVWSKPEKTYRGILYCTPTEVSIEGLKEIK